ncbi:MAG: hypothetical protein ACI4KF_04985 [Huintestinicola sp.]
MKKTIVILTLCMLFTACKSTVPASDVSVTEMTGTQLTESYSESLSEAEQETEDTPFLPADASDPEEDREGFTDTELREMEIVDEALSELMRSDGFKDLSTPEKAERALELLNDLAENGGEELTYPLIIKESIFHDGDDMISFVYACEVYGGVKLEPFDPMMN